MLVRPVVSEYCIGRPLPDPLPSALKASKITDEDARYHYLAGLLYQKRTDDNHLKEAIESYQRSLDRDPTRALTWVALSKAYSDSGDQKRAEYAVRRAVSVDRANPRVIWEAGMFYLTHGELREATPYLRHYLLLMPSEQEEVYTILHGAGAGPAYMLERVLPSEYQFHSRYFKFLMTYSQNAAVSDAWNQRNLWRPASIDYLAYCDFLIEKGLEQNAQGVWEEFVRHAYPPNIARDSSSVLFNGDFEYPIQNGGFDWKTGNAEGVEISIDKNVRKSGKSCLAARFSGKTNPAIYIAQQTVVVQPKQRYRLSGQIKTDKLTTHNGILLEVLGQGCTSLAARSDVVTGTTDWRPLELEFTTPAACSFVKVGVKRERSEKFDNKISGGVWLDEFRMAKVSN